MDRKKKAAVMAAVYAFVTDAEEARSFQETPLQEIGSEDPIGQKIMPGPGSNIWGMTGRQALMQANTMMQLRMFK